MAGMEKELLKAINRAALAMLSEQNYETGITEALKIVGSATQVDRVYIFQNVWIEPGVLGCSQRYEWARDSVSIQLDNPDLQNIPYFDAGIPRWLTTFRDRKVVKGFVKDFPDSEREILEPQEILAIICLPIYIKDEFWGFIGFDDCSYLRVWSDEEEEILFNLANSFGGLLMRQRYEQSLLKVKAELLDAQRIARMAHWELTGENHSLEHSPDFFPLFGLETAEPRDLGYLAALMDKQELAKITRLFANARTGNTPFDTIIGICPPGSDRKWLRVLGEPHQVKRGAVSGVVMDVTDSEVAARKLRDLTQRLQLAAASAGLGFWDWDVKQQSFYWDERVTAFLGTTAADSKMEELLQRIHPDDLNFSEADFLSNLHRQEKLSSLIRVKNARDEYRWLRIYSFVEQNAKGDPVRVVGVIQDITEEKNAAIQLEAAKNQSDKANRAKSEFLSVMSHEIRTPLNAVIGYSHLLLSENQNPEHQEYLQAMKFASENLLAIINDILDYSKIEAGKIDLEETEVHLGLLIRGVLQTHQHRAEEKNISLIKSLDARLPNHVLGDPVRLSQILTNLVSNAVKFTHDGKVELSALLVEEGQDTCKIRFVIKDTGIGIPEAQQAQIFESFTQANSSTTRKYGGTGLGLAITRRLVEMMGGEIQLVSEPGMGSEFDFTLPLRKAMTRTPEIKTQASSGEADEKDLSALSVLVVEDNEVNIKIITQFLKKWRTGAISVALNGEEGVKQLFSSTVDVVLMDIQMPVLNGLDAARAIRAAGNLTPIIALTADAMPDVREEIFASGMNDLTTKPFHPEVLYQKLKAFAPSAEVKIDA